MKGIEDKNGKLSFDDVELTTAPINQNGLEVVEGAERILKHNGVNVGIGSELKKGFEVVEVEGVRKLKFDGVILAEDVTPPEADEYISPEGYWIPIPQPDGVSEKNQSTASLIAKYDALMSAHPTYITKRRYEKSGVPILTATGGFELYSYVLEPENYTHTFFIGASVHGNERDAPIQLQRIVDILCNKTNTPPYAELKQLKDNVRFVLIPIISPYGYEVRSMNVPYEGSTYGVNMNRNYDYNHQYGIPGVGVGGSNPFDMVETAHIRDVINEFGAENFDFYMDMHDGGGVLEHYWINFNVDHPNRQPVKSFVNYLINKYEIADPVIPHVKDNGIGGMAQLWASKTLGIVSSTNEWIGGFLGYDFSVAQMTQSMEIRANIILMAYKENWRGNVINPINGYFNFDKGKSFTRATLRREGAHTETLVSDADIYGRWDLLMSKNPTLITKSPLLGYDAYGTQSIHTYTFGNGSTKVLYVGGLMRWGGTHKIDEYAIYQLIEYLCNDYYVNQSTHLQDLKNNYKIVVLPCIDNFGTNATTLRNAGLNQTVISPARWKITAGVTNPSPDGATNHGVIIVKNLIDSNADAKLIVSGGEIMEGYAFNPVDYSTDYEIQFVIPKNQTFDLTAFKTHLETNRNENVVVENTVGLTFGDYAYDNHGLKTYFIQQKGNAARWASVVNDVEFTQDDYQYFTWNAGRRISNIVNVFLK